MSPRFLSTWPGWATGSPGRNADRLLPETTEGGIHEKDGMDTEWHADGTCGRRVDIDCGHGFGSRQGPGGGVRTALAGRLPAAGDQGAEARPGQWPRQDRKSTRLNSSH